MSGDSLASSPLTARPHAHTHKHRRTNTYTLTNKATQTYSHKWTRSHSLQTHGFAHNKTETCPTIYYGEPYSKDNQQTFILCACVHVICGNDSVSRLITDILITACHLFCDSVCVCVAPRLLIHKQSLESVTSFNSFLSM